MLLVRSWGNPKPVFPDWGELSLAELHEVYRDMREAIDKSIPLEATLAGVQMQLQRAYVSANKGSRAMTLIHLMGFRRMLVPLMRYYDWAREMFLKLPLTEAAIPISGDPSPPVRELMDDLAGRINEVRSLREVYAVEIGEVDFWIRLRTAKMLGGKAKEEKERREKAVPLIEAWKKYRYKP